jgi:hypothetical protein
MRPPDLISCLFETSCSFNRRPFRPPALRWGAAKWPAPIGEVTALRWGRIQPDRIEVVERFYEGEFDDTKTDAGRRSIPLDSFGILRAVLDGVWQRSKYREPEDLVFANRRGGPVHRRNLLRRQLKPTG